MKLHMPISDYRLRRGVLTGLLFLFIALASPTDTAAQDEEEFTQQATRIEGHQRDAAALFNLGQDFHSKGEYEKALEFYEKALEKEPEFVEAEYQRGMVLKAINRTNDAEAAYRRVIELKSDWPEPLIQLGLLLIDRQKFDEAKMALDEAVRLDSNSCAAYPAITKLLLAADAPQARIEKHLELLRRVAVGKAVPASIWGAMSSLERKLGNHSGAKISILRAVEMDPRDIDLLAGLAEIELEMGEPESAMKTVSKILNLDRTSAPGLFLLARIYLAKGDSKGAIAALDQIQSPNENVLALRKAISANDNQSIESLEQLLAADSANPGILGKLCGLSRAADPRKALDYCKRALEIEKDNIDHAIGYGAALVQLKQYPGAAAVLRSLLKHSPENYTIHANLATALFQMEDFESAKSEYLWIAAKKPELAIAYYFLAISYDRLEEYHSAMENYKKFLLLADINENRLEVEKVNLRLPILEGHIRRGMGKKGSGI